MISEEPSSLNGGVRLEYHVQLVGGRNNGMRSFRPAISADHKRIGRVAIVHYQMIVQAVLMRFQFKRIECLRTRGSRARVNLFPALYASSLVPGSRNSEILTNLIRCPGVVMKCHMQSFLLG